MTVSSAVLSHSYVPGAAMLAESLAGLIAMQASELVVTDPDGVVQVPGTDYEITGNLRTGAASIRTLRAYTAGVQLTVTRKTSRVQLTQLSPTQPLPAKKIEDELDRRALIEQEQDAFAADVALRAIQGLPGQTGLALDTADLLDGDILQYRAGKLRRFDRSLFAGKFYAGGATGELVPASGTGNDNALRGDLASTIGDLLIKVGDKTLHEVLGNPNAFRLTGLSGVNGLPAAAPGTDESVLLAQAMYLMNFWRRPLIIDRTIQAISFTTVSGYCVVVCEEDCFIEFTGGTTGFRAENTYAAVGSWTGAFVPAQSPVGSGAIVSTVPVDAASYAALNVGDRVFLGDSVPNTFTYNANSTSLADWAQVIDKTGGNTLWFDRTIDEAALYAATGTIYKVDQNECVLDIKVRGEKTQVREAVRIEGYICARGKVRVEGNSSRGFMPVSCYMPVFEIFARDLRDDESANCYGYGCSPFGATVDGYYKIYAEECRHAYTDGIIGGVAAAARMRQGVCRRNTVTGVAVRCTAASWDTHPNSKGTLFINIVAWGTHSVSPGQTINGLNWAMQVRGNDVTVDGFTTDIRQGIIYVGYAVVSRASVTEVKNFTHQCNFPGAYAGLNSMISVGFFSKTGTGTHTFICRNSSIHNFTTTGGGWTGRFVDCEIDRTTTASSMAGDSTCRFELENCELISPGSLTIAGGYVFRGGLIRIANSGGLNLIDGADVTAINVGIERPALLTSLNKAFAYTTIAAGTVKFQHAGLWINSPNDAARSVRPFADLSTGGAVTVKSLAIPAEFRGTATKGNADVTLQVGVDEYQQTFNTALTAARTITLKKKGATSGDSFYFTRPAGGAFALSIINDTAGATILTLATGEAGIAMFNGVDWFLVIKGTC
ncbi:hypothetical protein [Novosphingobium sp.]|uniref:hypothetical protein n=1 Tax=Novosphingobium sp. TaxID=1874826 RepID=UPI00261A8F06|nr:hypothetical protein [Novosphingobium sp.]